MKLEIPLHIFFKLQVWRDLGNTEVTGFFITEKDEPLKVIDAILIESECSGATVDIEAEAIEAMYMEYQKQQIYPDQLQIWWHTHPGNSPSPSSTDVSTFNDLGSDKTSNVMYILASGNQEYCRVSVSDPKTGFVLEEEIKITHPLQKWQDMPEYEELKADYDKYIKPKIYQSYYSSGHMGWNGHNWVQNQNNNYANNRVTNKNWKSNVYPPAKNVLTDRTHNQNQNNSLKQIQDENNFDAMDQSDIDYWYELNDLVESGSITSFQANRSAELMSHGQEFYTRFLPFLSDHGTVDDIVSIDNKTDESSLAYCMIDNIWTDAMTIKEFFEELLENIEKDYIDVKDVNFYLEANEFDAFVENGEIKDTTELGGKQNAA